MMINIKQTIENKYYQDPRGEFFPIYQDGELANKLDFHLYKAGNAARTLGHIIGRSIEVGATALDHMVEASNQK